MKTNVIFAIAALALALTGCSSDTPNVRPPGTSEDEGAATGDDGDDDTADDGPVMDAGSKRDASTIDSGRVSTVDSGRADGGGKAADGGGKTADGGATAMDGSAPTDPGDPEFDTCLAAVKPVCVAREMNTAELMETPCRELTMPPIPLTGGGTYGPVTLKAGPYGGRAEWNDGAGTPFVNPVNAAEPICVPIGIETFMEPAAVNAEIKNLRDVDYSLYTIFRPACFKPGEKYPVITWANGTCGEIAGYAPLLSAIASYGLRHHRLELDLDRDRAHQHGAAARVGLRKGAQRRSEEHLLSEARHGQHRRHGALAGRDGDRERRCDPRIKSVIFWNTGNSNEKPFLNVSGQRGRLGDHARDHEHGRQCSDQTRRVGLLPQGLADRRQLDRTPRA